MTPLESVTWAVFKLGDIFDRIERAKRRTLHDYSTGDVPYVTNSSLNNGVSAYLQPKTDEDIESGRCITVNTVDGSAFWQERDFLANSSGNGLLLLRSADLNELRALFLCSAIDAVLEAGFTVMLTLDAVRDAEVHLPVSPSGKPDWRYMEDAMRAVLAMQAENLDAVIMASGAEEIVVETSSWQSFTMQEIFEMRNTKSITAGSLIPDSGKIPYVTAQDGNNGVHMYVECPKEWLETGGCILIGGKTLAFSYQEQDFCSNDSHNIALYSRDLRSKSVTCQLFLMSVLRASFGSTYSWNDSISMKRVKEESLMLPVTAVGEPDWEYMAQKMGNIWGDRKSALESIRVVDQKT